MQNFSGLDDILGHSNIFHSFLDNFPTMLWTCDASGNCMYFSEALASFLGNDPDSDGLTPYIHQSDAECREAAIKKLLIEKTPFTIEFQLKNHFGLYRWIKESCLAVFDTDNKTFRGFFGVCTDITDKKEAELGLLKYNIISDYVKDIVFIIDLHGRILESNTSAVEAYGYTKEEFLQKTIFEIRRQTPLTFAQMLAAYNNGLMFEAIHYRKDGSHFPVEVSSQGTIINDEKVLVSVIRDISQRKMHEEEIIKAKDAAEISNKAKSSFLANMSHEIRTPLNGILGMTDLTLLTDLSEEQQENLMIVKSCVDTLLNLVNNILDISKIEAGKLALSINDINIYQLLKDSLEPHFYKAREKGLELQFDCTEIESCMFKGDSYRIQQIINNLVANAIKFTDSGTISVCAAPINSDDIGAEILFSVKDTGIGIDENDINKLFKVFSQVDVSFTRKYQGAGLGLSICRQLVDKMNGRIWVESKLNHGSTFYFTLKLDYADTYSIKVSNQETFKNHKLFGSGLKILLAEDNKYNQSAIKKFTSRFGLALDVVNDAQKAVDAFKTKDYNVIILDDKMPEINGIDAAKLIKAHENNRDHPIKIINLSSIETFDNISSAYSKHDSIDFHKLENTLSDLIP